jgi:endonuclease YncB( thermonuclease family)
MVLLGCQKSNRVPNIDTVSATPTNSFRNVQYVSVYDGDTFTVNLPDTIPDIFSYEISVRVRHIDTAEMKGSNKCEREMAEKAKAATTTLLKNAKRIDLEDVGRDKFFRILSQVVITTTEGKLIVLSKYMLDNNYAVPYEGEKKQVANWCKILELRSKH